VRMQEPENAEARLVQAALQAVISGEIDGPFFIYDLDALVEAVRNFEGLANNASSHSAQVLFPMFSNPNTEMLRVLTRVNPATGILVNSPEEAEILDRRGIGSRARRVFTGGVVGRDQLRRLADLCEIVHCSSLGDLRHLCDIVRESRRAAVGIGLRVDLNGDALKGLTRSELPGAWRCVEAAGLRPLSLHAYPGTEIADCDELLLHADLLLQLATEYPIDVINFGGGFGYDYSASCGSIDLPNFFRRFGSMVSSLEAQQRLRPGTTFAWEPGRVLAAGMGAYVARVIEVRPREPGSCDLYIDGTFANLPAPKIRNRQHRVSVFAFGGQARTDGPQMTRICGATTLSTDTLLPGRLLLPRAEAGDVVVVWDVGCYGRSGSYNFLGRCLPAEIGLQGDRLRVLRRVQTADELFGPEPDIEGEEMSCLDRVVA